MLKRETEPCSQLGFQLNTYGMDLSEYWIYFMLSFIVFGIIYIVNLETFC